MPSQFQTTLPDAPQPSLGNGVEDEVAVTLEDVTNNGDDRIQIRETGESSWDESALGFDEVVLTSDGDTTGTVDTIFAGREDGEELEVRARTETEHVQGAWTQPVSIITQFPGITNLSVANVDAESVTLEATDNADNEAGVRVWRRDELDPLRDTGYGDWQLVDDANPHPGTGKFTYTDTTVKPNHDYEYYLEPYTPYASEDSGTVGTTTLVDVPSEGYYIVLESSAGEKATVGGDRFEGHPNIQPEQMGVARWTVDLRPQPVLRDWKRSELHLYKDGSLWIRGPYTRYHPNGDGDASAQVEGLGVLQHLKGGGQAYSVTSTPGYEAIEAFGDEELPDWLVDVTRPSSQTVDENFTVQDDTTGDDLESRFDMSNRITREEDVLRPAKVSFTRKALSRDSDTGFTNPSINGAVDGTAVGISIPSHSVSYVETAGHDIPESEVGFRIRFLESQLEPQATEYVISINGSETVLGGFPSGFGISNDAIWYDLVDQFGWDGGDITAGDTVEFIVRGWNSGESGDDEQLFDILSVYDKRSEDDLTWNHDLTNEQLDGPEYYTPVSTTTAAFSQSFNITAAHITAGVSDASGGQALEASNDQGATWLPSDGSESNTSMVTADFDTAGTYGSAVQGRITLDGYEPDGPRNDTPRLGYAAQELTAWELAIDTNALRVIDDQTYTGSPWDILTDLAEDSGMTVIPDYREDTRALRAFAPGDVVEDPDWTVEDADPVDTTEGYYNSITVFGPEPEDDSGERLSATATSTSEVERVGEVPGPAAFRPDATSEEELVSIARTKLAEGISADTVTGMLEISGQLVQPGIAYKIPEFAELDDREDPAYVLQSGDFEWGTMQLDFEGRASLADAFASIETEVKVAKRAV